MIRKLYLSPTALQISNNLRTKLPLTGHSRFVATTVNREALEYNVCIGVPSCPSQVVKISLTDLPSSIVVVLAVLVIRIIVVNPQSLPQANLQQHDAQRVNPVCMTVQALWVRVLSRVLVVVKLEATDIFSFHLLGLAYCLECVVAVNASIMRCFHPTGHGSMR
jgi:hypothetical protein